MSQKENRPAALVFGEAAFAEYLKQNLEYGRMGFLDFINREYALGNPFRTYPPRRTNQ